MNSFPAVKCRTMRIMKHGNCSGGHKSLEEPAICHVDVRELDFPQKVMNAGLSGLCGELQIHLVHHPCAQANGTEYSIRLPSRCHGSYD